MASVDEAQAEPAHPRARFAYAVKVCAVAAVYFLAGRFGIEQDVAHGVVTPVWAPSGIAIASLVLFGPRLWPAVAIGAFLTNASGGISIVVAAAIAVGNTLEAVAASYLLGRVGFSASLTRVRDVLWFVALAATASTAVSASVGVTALTVGGEVPIARFGEEWLLWWFGDLIGTVMVGPPILAWVSAHRTHEVPARRIEGLALTILLVGAALAIFVGGSWRYPYVIFPLLIWAALRFRQVGATTAIALVGGIATWGTANGAVPIGGASATQAVQLLQGLIAIVGIGTFVTAATITERDEAEADRSRVLAQLHERNSMYETLLQAVSDLGEGFLVTDAGRLVFANAAYCEMTGYTFEELLELPSLLELTAPEQREEIAARLRDRLAGGQVVDHYEAALVRKDGRRVECEVAVELAETDQGPRLVSVVRDVTERKRIENFRTNFVSYAAHELRSPIAVIAGFLEVLRDDPNREVQEKEQILDRISANVSTMRTRIENMLSLTHIERGQADLRPDNVVLAGALEQITASLPAPGGKSLDIQAMPGVAAWIDKSALEQIVANLVTNAYRYGGSRVQIVGRAGAEGTIIEVTDDGPGIPPTEAARIFEPFVRGASATRTDGAGLGLSIVKALVEASDGEIVYRHDARGSTFAVHLPASAPSALDGAIY